LAEGLRIISVLIQPVMPETPKKILSQLGLENHDNINGYAGWETAKVWGIYPLDAKVCKGEIIFPRIDIEKELGNIKNEENGIK